jgi:hypothetical protein
MTDSCFFRDIEHQILGHRTFAVGTYVTFLEASTFSNFKDTYFLLVLGHKLCKGSYTQLLVLASYGE